MTLSPIAISFDEIIKQVARALEKQKKCKYCLIGGHAASLYRAQERFTKDVDFAVLGDPVSTSRRFAQKAIQSIGLKPMLGFIPGSEKEPARKNICMLTSAPSAGETKGVVDILLPELPWVTSAVERAQHNLIDLGFAQIPVITAEDLIVAKCYALNNSPDRFQDLDDLKQIFESVKDLDLDYLRGKLVEFHIPLPKLIQKYAPFKIRKE